MAQKTPLDRRGFMRIAGSYGLRSTAFAVAGRGGPPTPQGGGRADAGASSARFRGRTKARWGGGGLGMRRKVNGGVFRVRLLRSGVWALNLLAAIRQKRRFQACRI